MTRRSRGIDLLYPTKLVPEELCPVENIATMILNRRPVNSFAETEQVMSNRTPWCLAIDVTNDRASKMNRFLTGNVRDCREPRGLR